MRGEPELVQPVLDVYYELNPTTAALDLLLRVTTQPIDIVYNEDIIDRLESNNCRIVWMFWFHTLSTTTTTTIRRNCLKLKY